VEETNQGRARAARTVKPGESKRCEPDDSRRTEMKNIEPTPYPLPPTPCPTSYPLHRTTYTLHPTPYTLHP
jgi:hypothetical protein